MCISDNAGIKCKILWSNAAGFTYVSAQTPTDSNVVVSLYLSLWVTIICVLVEIVLWCHVPFSLSESGKINMEHYFNITEKHPLIYS